MKHVFIDGSVTGICSPHCHRHVANIDTDIWPTMLSICDQQCCRHVVNNVADTGPTMMLTYLEIK